MRALARPAAAPYLAELLAEFAATSTPVQPLADRELRPHVPEARPEIAAMMRNSHASLLANPGGSCGEALLSVNNSRASRTPDPMTDERETCQI